jgi:hypothetical protein
MAALDPQKTVELLKGALEPWHEAVNDPAAAQQRVLRRLVEVYALTSYGAEHGASRIETIEHYRRAFPVCT